MDWSSFACPQSTGGIVIMLSKYPKHLDSLQTIGTTVFIFIFNLILFPSFAGIVLTRWVSGPGSSEASSSQSPNAFLSGLSG